MKKFFKRISRAILLKIAKAMKVVSMKGIKFCERYWEKHRIPPMPRLVYEGSTLEGKPPESTYKG